MLEKQKPDFWRDIKPGSTITLSDSQTLEEAMLRGDGVLAQDYIVEKILKIRQDKNLAEWLLFKLQDDDERIHLMVKMVDNEVELRVYFEPEFDAFDQGSRKDLIRNEEYWLFQEPDDPDNIKYDELNFTEEFVWTFDDGTEEFDVDYYIKHQEVLYGLATYKPEQSGINAIFTAVVEYSAKADVDNPEALLLELGGENSADGGWITLMFGCSISTEEVDVLKI